MLKALLQYLATISRQYLYLVLVLSPVHGIEKSEVDKRGVN